ncbi:MAG: hypothetical protein Q6353_001010 [Candidatus Sigynarchaeum springense]
MQKTVDNIHVDASSKIVTIDATINKTPLRYQFLNEQIHRVIDDGYKNIVIKNVAGQRFIGAALVGDINIKIHGTPGNDLGIFMDGPSIEVFGNVEDQAGNTMNGGKIVIHGSARDVIGLSARGGTIYVRGDGGYRCGVHIKQYQSKRPVFVFGGRVRDFFGEYMAGGILVALGLNINEDGSFNVIKEYPVAGRSIGTGIHGGKIILARKAEEIPCDFLGTGTKVADLEEDDIQDIKPILADFCKAFGIDAARILKLDFSKVIPLSKRPFAHNYCSKMV